MPSRKVKPRVLLAAKIIQRGVLAVSGQDILINLADQDANAEWVRAYDRQGGLEGIIEYGMSLITWAPDDFPQRLILPSYGEAKVVADPQFAFGQFPRHNTTKFRYPRLRMPAWHGRLASMTIVVSQGTKTRSRPSAN